MPGVHDFWLFVAAGLLLNVTPGADTLYIVSRSAAQGSRAGAVAALGIGAGCVVHALAAALGLSAIIATSAAAFALVKWVGAAYLVWLGISLLASRRAPSIGPAAAPASLGSVFAQGFLTNLLNPKVALFFLAFLPQFVEPEATRKALTLLLLGVVFNVNGTLWNLFVAWTAAGVGRRFRVPGPAAAWLSRAAGAAFVALGARLALAERA
jgi:threonine/homoserine/homoserine lactone efflux protein